MGGRCTILCIALATLGCEGTTALTGDDDASPGPGCTLSADIVEDTVLGVSFCQSYRIELPVTIRDGATLSIAAGTELHFDRGAGITVGDGSDGRLEILGRPGAEVLLTSLAPSEDASGRWSGILFRGSTLPGSVIRHAIIDNATGEAGGCVMLESTAPGAVKLEALRIQGCSTAGVWLDVPSLELIAPLSIADAEIGISLAARNVGSLTVPPLLERVAANEIRGGAIVQSATWVAQRVPWVVRGNIEIEDPSIPVLTLEAGVHLRFDPSTWLVVGEDAPGALRAIGTEDAPVILESNNAGGWHGVVIGAQADLRTVFEHAVLRGAGRRGQNVRGCLTIRSSTPISVTSSRFEACEQAGIGAIGPAFRFGRLTGNAFTDSLVGLWLNARAVGSVTSEQSFDGVTTNMIEGDELAGNAIWIRQSIPWTVRDSISVQGAEAPVLRLEPGVHLRFAASSWLQIGSAAGGGLVAIGTETEPIIFESASMNAGPGTWRGIVFGSSASAGSRIERAIVRHGGQAELDARGCITVRGGTARPISIVRSVFESCAQAGISAIDGGFQFEALTDNLFRDSEAGLHLAASSVGSVRAPQRYEDVPLNRIFGGPITNDAFWSRQDVPWVAGGIIRVEGDAGPILTLESGLDLRFEEGALMIAGESAPATLVIAGAPQAPVSLTGAGNTSGLWGGVLLGPAIQTGTRIDYALIANAGHPDAGLPGAVTLEGTGDRVRIASTEFRDNALADVFVDCDSAPMLAGNAYSSTGVQYEACN